MDNKDLKITVIGIKAHEVLESLNIFQLLDEDEYDSCNIEDYAGKIPHWTYKLSHYYYKEFLEVLKNNEKGRLAENAILVYNNRYRYNKISGLGAMSEELQSDFNKLHEGKISEHEFTDEEFELYNAIVDTGSNNWYFYYNGVIDIA